MTKRLYLILTIISISVLGFASSVGAEDFFELSRADLSDHNRFAFISPSAEVGIYFSGANADSFVFKAMTLVPKDMIGGYFSYSENLVPASDLYLVKRPMSMELGISLLTEIKVKYNQDNRYKEIYFFNWSTLSFEKIESVRDELNRTLTFVMPESKKTLIFGVFGQAEIFGAASWYVHPKYKDEFMAASRDFAKGSRVRVTNMDNGREVTVTIMDYGPKRCADWTEEENRLMGPCQARILDLSKNAFAALASVYQGIIPIIKVTPFFET